MTLKDEWNMVEAINVKLLADLRAYEHTETLMQHQINGLESELAAANDSIERSKDYECELRAEVGRLTERNEALEKGLATKVSLHTARIAELEGALEAALTQLDGACRRAGDDTDTIHIETQQARAALSQEKK
jgi:septal ring factor EnvC (AmiA/AmiB activator)